MVRSFQGQPARPGAIGAPRFPAHSGSDGSDRKDPGSDDLRLLDRFGTQRARLRHGDGSILQVPHPVPLPGRRRGEVDGDRRLVHPEGAPQGDLPGDLRVCERRALDRGLQPAHRAAPEDPPRQDRAGGRDHGDGEPACNLRAREPLPRRKELREVPPVQSTGRGHREEVSGLRGPHSLLGAGAAGPQDPARPRPEAGGGHGDRHGGLPRHTGRGRPGVGAPQERTFARADDPLLCPHPDPRWPVEGCRRDRPRWARRHREIR